LLWQVEPALIERFRRLNETGKGLIIVGYHFGFFSLSATALANVFPGCNAVHMSHRTAHYAGDAFDAVAQLALEKAYAADQQSGARIEYVESGKSLLRVCRMLLAGDTVAMAADGAFAHDFVEVPFLDSQLRLPCGWARMAAATGSNVLVLLDTEIDRRSRRAHLFDHVHVLGDDPQEIRRAVTEVGKILDELVRSEPWAWHPWGRLCRETTSAGSVYYLASGTPSRGPQPAETTNSSG
jgi:lauroyl/myristoyl acyltransferase